jgi:hypothetical protein
MGSITTAFPSSFKNELAQGMHCFTGPISTTGTTAISTTISALGSQANLCRGMTVTDSTNPTALTVPTFVVDLPTGTTATISPIGVSAHAGDTLIFSGDTFFVALVKVTPTGVYGAATTNYSNVTGNSDEASGTGYAAGGIALTANITPALTTTTATWSWTTNPSWAAVTVSVVGCVFYNDTTRAGALGRCVYVGSFGGTQTVTAGTLTLVLPTNAPGTAILQIS